MKLVPKILIICLISIIPLSAIAQPLQSWIPPTNAFDKIHSDNGTINAVNYSMPLNIKGTSGITVNSNNSTHTLTISSSTATATGTYNETQANNVVINSNGNKINFINGSGTNILVQDSQAGSQVNVTISSTGSGTNQGTYNQTLANNTIINSGGHRINFLNETTQNTIHIINDPTRNQVNVTINNFAIPIRPGSISWYQGAISNTANSLSIGGAYTANTTYAYPFLVGQGFTGKKIGFDVNTTPVANNKCMVALYNDNGTSYPNIIIVTGTDQDTTTTGMKTDVINTSLNSNSLYWAVFNCKTMTTVRFSTLPMAGLAPILGWSGSDGVTQEITMYKISATHNSTGFSFPSTFPSTAIDQINLNPIAVFIQAG